MRRLVFLVSAAALLIGVVAGALLAQQTQPAQPFFVGNRLGLPVNPAADGAFEAISSNVKVYGSITPPRVARMTPGARHRRAEPRVPQNVQANNAWVSL